MGSKTNYKKGFNVSTEIIHLLTHKEGLQHKCKKTNNPLIHILNNFDLLPFPFWWPMATELFYNGLLTHKSTSTALM